jgi:hypothetical protein
VHTISFSIANFDDYWLVTWFNTPYVSSLPIVGCISIFWNCAYKVAQHQQEGHETQPFPWSYVLHSNVKSFKVFCNKHGNGFCNIGSKPMKLSQTTISFQNKRCILDALYESFLLWSLLQFFFASDLVCLSL